MHRGSRRVAMLVVLCVGVCLASGAVMAGGATSQADANNTTVQQENPELVGGGGDLVGLRDVLADRLARQLGDSVIELEQGEYEVARDLLDDEARSLLGKYVDVVGETRDEDDDETAETFREARDTGEEFVNATQSFYETYEAYQEARENGNTRRARRLARELDRQGQTVQATGNATRRSFRNVERASGENLTRARRAVTETVANVSTIRQAVRTDLFRPTRMEVQATDAVISYTDPLVVRGRLTTRNGTALADRPIRLVVANRRYSVTTNATGWFRFRYRPTTIRLNTTTVEVAYVPEADSPYLASRASLPVTIEQVEPTVAVTTAPGRVGFGDRLEVTGTVGAVDVGAPGVPVVVSLGGEPLARTTTGPNGTFSVASTVPASIPNGTQSLRVRVALADRALAGTTTARPVTVASTPSSITVTATERANAPGEVVIRGRVEAADRGVPNALVRFELAGVDVGATTTNASGGFTTTVDAAAVLDGATGRTVTRPVVVRFAGAGTNLEPSVGRTTVAVTVPSAQPTPTAATDPGGEGPIEAGISATREAVDAADTFARENPGLAALLAILGLAGLVVVGWVVWAYREPVRSAVARGGARVGPPVARAAPPVRRGVRRSVRPIARLGAAVWALLPTGLLPGGEADGSTAGMEGDVSSSSEPATDAPAPAGPTQVLADAHELLADGAPDAAVKAGYAAVRTSFPEAERTQSHWEFYRAVAADGYDGKQVAALRELTEGYERAAFAPDGVDTAAAAAALEAATRTLDRDAASAAA